jgi:hypothetical protein
MHCFTRHPKMMRAAYLPLLSRFLDTDVRHTTIPKGGRGKTNTSTNARSRDSYPGPDADMRD